MTLADVERLASRLEAAAKVIRDAQALMGGASAKAPVVAVSVPATPPEIAADPQLAADRMRLMQQFKKGDLPPELEAAAGIS